MDRTELKRQEVENLRQAFILNPEFFSKKWYTEDREFLRQFGIIIPGKESCPHGYLKLYSSDFIVEEISTSGKVSTINKPSQSEVFPTQDKHNENHRALFATLVKCNITTNEAVDEMAQKLGCDPRDIRYAGLKDKNGITAQSLSFHNMNFEKVAQISSPHYFLKDLYFGKGGVEKGALSGNRFTLFIRTPQQIDQEAFKKQQEYVEKNGFYNFFYLQRFGAPRFINFQWGFDIARGRYKDAVVSFFTSTSTRELGYIQELRKKIAAAIPDWNKVYEIVKPFPLIFFIEHKFTLHLQKNPDDFLGALKTVPEQVMLWVYGFGSLLFNEMLSSYTGANKPVPEKIPLLLSNDPRDIEYYSSFLKRIKYYPPDFKNLRPFTHLILRKRLVPTMEKITIEKIAHSPDGVAVRFSLNKGEYATTFLSHLFNLISGNAPDSISSAAVNSPNLLGTNDISATLDHFKEINIPKKEFSLQDMDAV